MSSTAFRLVVLLGCLLLAFMSFPKISAQSCMGSTSSPGQSIVSAAELGVPEKAKSHLKKAQKLVDADKLREARPEVEAALAISPDFPQALTFRAMLRQIDNQSEDALADLEHSLKLNPRLPFTYLAFGATFNHMGRFDEALRSLDRCLEMDPAMWQCSLESSKAWLAKREYAAALAQVSCASQRGGATRDPAAMSYVRGYALYGLKEYKQAALELKKFVQAEPNTSYADVVRKTLAEIDAAQAAARPN